jgi:hypothetical protein
LGIVQVVDIGLLVNRSVGQSTVLETVHVEKKNREVHEDTLQSSGTNKVTAILCDVSMETVQWASESRDMEGTAYEEPLAVQ